jgi:hypothetical protein
MSACAKQTFNNVSPAAWQCVKQAAAEYGVNGADSGQQTVSGFTVAWNYSAATQTLEIQCLDSPFFVSCSTINAHIHDAVDHCLQSHQLEVTRMVTG